MNTVKTEGFIDISVQTSGGATKVRLTTKQAEDLHSQLGVLLNKPSFPKHPVVPKYMHPWYFVPDRNFFEVTSKDTR